jgi:CheY-like chemotaxis protein/Tfp pilus assembly protein PilZ
MSTTKGATGKIDWPSRNASRSTVQRTVLVVDDVPYLLELASLFLARTARVITATSASQALELARRRRPDLIVSDYQMPGMSGADLCRAAAADPRLCSTPFVMLVSGTHGSERGAAIRAGAADVLAKPLSRLSLIEAVSRQLGGARYRSLPRVDLEIPVRFTAATREEIGVVRNVSRGGVFVETPCELTHQSEVDLRFRLPGSPHLLAASAQVIWSEPVPSDSAGPGSTAGRSPRHGFGLRFLDIDRAGIRSLDDFVFERVAPSSRPSPTATS